MKPLLLLAFAAVSMHAAQIEYTLNNGTSDLLTFVTDTHMDSPGLANRC
jgi:hypothetical protein